MTRPEILAAARALPRRELVALAHELLELAGEGLADDLPEVEWRAAWDEAWGEEAERRLAELRDGTVKAVPGELVRTRMRSITGS